LFALTTGNLAFLTFAIIHEGPGQRTLSRTAIGLNLAALGLALISFARQQLDADAAINFAGTLLATSSGTTLLLRRLFRRTDDRREALRRWLSQPATRVQGDAVLPLDSQELRPGEEIVVHAGETVVADATVVAGRAEIYPWFGASTVHSVGPEDFVYAGATLASGQLRATVRWTGLDRHWERLTNDPARAADDHSPVVILAKKLSFWGAPLLTVVALSTGISANNSPVHWILIALASFAAMLSPAIHRLTALRIMRSVVHALNHGIVFRSAAALDAAGRVSAAVFCARGTLLLGEPELSTIDANPGTTQDEALALAAGAEQARQHPSAVALIRAARARGVTPDAVRSPQAEHGLGVTAVAANGKPLVVGSRALLLRERVSVARAEQRITELEAMGRSVVLVALGNHLVGILALQDGLRAGARAAVQHLLDAGIEPILLSGDARKSCESLGRTIDIDHVRPEVLPADRGREVERLRSGGAQVAVIGLSPIDEVALGAASVSVALPSAGTPNMDHDIELATNEVQKAALALRLAHQSRAEASRAFVIAFGGAVVTVLGVVALSAPVALVPLACMAFSLAAAATLPADVDGDSGSTALDRGRESTHTV
jgi:P-type E1-E2 ATPase